MYLTKNGYGAMVIRIDDISSSDVKVYTGLNEKQVKRIYEPGEGLFICESEKVIKRAIVAGYEPESFFVAEDKVDSVSALAGGDSKIYAASPDIMRRITGYALTGGVLAAMRRKPLKAPKELIKNVRKIVVLDDVENPTNVGAIFRSAAALGAEGILLTEGCADPLYRRAARVSMGTVFQIEWTYVHGNVTDILRDSDYYTIALALEERAVSISDVTLSSHKKRAVILGNEEHGISRDIMEKCDACAMIPMNMGVDSLNVAAAGAVAFWEIFGK